MLSLFFFRVAFPKSLCHANFEIFGGLLMRLLLLLGILGGTAVFSFAAPVSGWQSLGFDGSGFLKGAATGAIQVRDGYLPVPGTSAAAEDRLPDGTGALAVFCFQQRAGGKLRPQGGSAPMPAVAVTLVGKKVTLAARTDASGYLILALPPGSYDLGLFGLSKKVNVQSGKTALVVMRGGKRMVD